MNKKKILSLGLVSAMCVPLALCAVGCGKKNENNQHLKVNSKDVYAMSVATSVNYLKESQLHSLNVANASTRPENVNLEDVTNLKSCIGLFGEVITNNGITQQTENNNKDLYSQYNFVMEISFPNSEEILTMYYNESNQQTKEEIEDCNKEVEVSTNLEGIVVYNSNTYNVEGVREVETKGNNVEVEIEFTTYLDSNNYITVKQSVENNELEYEYSIFENNNKIQEVELEIEYKNSNIEVEFQIVDLTSHLVKETEYKLYKNKNNLYGEINKNGIKENIVINKEADVLTFTYSNGYSETV